MTYSLIYTRSLVVGHDPKLAHILFYVSQEYTSIFNICFKWKCNTFLLYERFPVKVPDALPAFQFPLIIPV